VTGHLWIHHTHTQKNAPCNKLNYTLSKLHLIQKLHLIKSYTLSKLHLIKNYTLSKLHLIKSYTLFKNYTLSKATPYQKVHLIKNYTLWYIAAHTPISWWPESTCDVLDSLIIVPVPWVSHLGPVYVVVPLSPASKTKLSTSSTSRWMLQDLQLQELNRELPNLSDFHIDQILNQKSKQGQWMSKKSIYLLPAFVTQDNLFAVSISSVGPTSWQCLLIPHVFN